jgi:hypothetical protein
MTTQQMELGFDDVWSGGLMESQPRRAGRASWWFERMRQIVDRAMDWEPAPLPRPEQIWFAGAHRQVEAGTMAARPTTRRDDPAESEICE